MVKIYTKKGDDGTTSLWYGGRVPKHHGRTDAYGSLDEACSQLGVARALCGADDEGLAADILLLQDDLFVAGAELATAPEAAERLEDGISRTTEEMVAWMEERIDHYMGQVELPPKFVIPGGNQLSAQLDVARTVIRRAERRISELAADILRLQDDIFVAGAELATAPEAAGRLEDGVSRTTEEMVAWIDGRIDRYMGEVDLPPKFVIPGGNQLSAQLDVARTVVRRAERQISELAEQGELASETVIHLVNRASDLAYAMARFADVEDPALFEGRDRG